MLDINEAILGLNLSYELEYAVINLDDKGLFEYQRKFFDFLLNRKNMALVTSLEGDDIRSRVYTDSIMKNAKSMIIFLFPYMTARHCREANLSVYCMGEDYHIYAKKYLYFIAERLKSVNKNSNFYVQVDTGLLNERFFAFYSGLGILGINSMIISKIYGSYVNIGLIVTDLYMEEVRYERTCCDKCMACLKACPGSAVNGDFTINSLRCASYITQKKGELSEDDRDIIRRSKKVFGCDICQNVCHFNNNVKTIPVNYDIINKIKFGDIYNMSNKKFKEKYKDRAFSFRGKGVIIRNMECLGENIE